MMKTIVTTMLAFALMLSCAQGARAESWALSGNPADKSAKIKVSVSMSYMDTSLGKAVTRKYIPTALDFSMTKDADGTSDIVLKLSGGGLTDLTASMHGTITQVGKKYYVSGCYNSANEAVNPFNFSDDSGGDRDISSSGVTATSVEGSLTDEVVSKIPTGNVKTVLTFNMVGKDTTGTPEKIIVKLSATALLQ